MTQRTHKRDVSFVKLIDPKFLSLVNSPANKTGFKVIRDDDGHTMKIRQRFLNKRSDQSSLLAITLPSSIGEAEAVELMEFFNLGDDYSVFATEDGDYVLRRADAENAEFPRQIEMGNGFSVLVEAKAVTRSDKNVTGVTLTGITFADSSMDEVVAWLGEHDMQGHEAVENEDGTVQVQRAECPEGEGREVTIGEGIKGTVIRSKETDVPLQVYRSVVEESYGQWGWGQLDYAAALASPEFEDKSWNAISVLRDVLTQIITHSDLPLDDRKTLVENACGQFASYIGGLLDALPKGLIEKAISRNDDDTIQEAGDMAIKKDAVKRDDEQTPKEKAAVPAAASTTEAKTEQTPEYVTRADLDEVVTTAVTTAVTAAMAEHVTRSDGETEKEVSAIDKLAQAVDKINTNVETVSRSMKTLQDEVTELGGETNVADKEGEETSGTEETQKETVKRSEKASVYTGMFGNRFS